MSSFKRHEARWKSIFQGEPWWEMHLALYDGPGSDWEGAGEAMELMVYQLAKARGLDTTQGCQQCGKVVDEPTTLSQWYPCEACRQQADWRDQAEFLLEVERKIAEDFRRSKLTPEERETEDQRLHEQVRSYLEGLISRDVQ